MTAPLAQATVDEPEGGYAYGDPVTITITGTSQNTTPVVRNFTAVVEDAAEDTPLSGSYTVNQPNPLKASISSSDAPGPWTPGVAAQQGAAFTATFTTAAG